MTLVRLKPAAPRSPVKHYTTETLRSLPKFNENHSKGSGGMEQTRKCYRSYDSVSALWLRINNFWPAVDDLFDLILYVPSTIFELCRDRSSWVEPVLS